MSQFSCWSKSYAPGEKNFSENDRQSALRMSKMINDVTADFKVYHISIVDQITDEE